jgi:ATP synthase subunit 6
MRSPLEQFTVTPILYIFSFFEFFGINLTNFSVFCLVFTLVCSSIALFCVFSGKILPSTRQYIIEAVFEFVLNMVQSNLKAKQQRYLPLFFFIFCFILFVNLFGLFPYGFTLSSQIVFACILSFSAFLGLILIGIKNYKINFFALFFPSEAPVFLAALLVPIEIVSFFSRPFSLAIRLFANMTAGHVLLKILAGFIVLVFSNLFGLHLNFSRVLEVFHLKDVQHVQLALFDFYTLTYSLVREDLLLVCCDTHVFPQLSSLLNIFSKFFLLDSLTIYDHSSLAQELMSDDYSNTKLEGNYGKLLSQYVSCFIQFSGQPTLASFFPYFKLSESLFTSSFYFNSFNNPLIVFSVDFVVSFINACLSLMFSALVICFLLLVLIIFVILEVFVAVLQAYVFSILLVIYLRDMFELH